MQWKIYAEQSESNNSQRDKDLSDALGFKTVFMN